MRKGGAESDTVLGEMNGKSQVTTPMFGSFGDGCGGRDGMTEMGRQYTGHGMIIWNKSNILHVFNFVLAAL